MSDETATTDQDESAGGGPSVGAAAQQEVSEEELQEIEAEREERLDPENRPDNVEVDNTGREFDASIGQFTDHEPDPEIGPFHDPEAEGDDGS